MNHRNIRAALLAVLAITLVALTAATISQAHDEHGPAATTHAAPKGMKVSIKVKKDKMKGHNLFIKSAKFRWAPEHASGKHVRGEGHAHLMIDGKAVTRIYGPAYFLGGLPSGTHTVTVSLNGNDHLGYARRGKAIEDSAAVVIP